MLLLEFVAAVAVAVAVFHCAAARGSGGPYVMIDFVMTAEEC